MGTGRFAHGTELRIGDGDTPESFTAIPLLGDGTFVNPMPKMIVIPDHSDPSGYVKYIPGLRDKGKVSFKLSYDPDEPTHVAARASAGTICNWQVVPPVATEKARQFRAIVSFPEAFPENDKWDGTIDLDITGPVTEVDR